ncbi:MAG: bacterioferritin [Micropepsaceae bacterium]
MKGEPAVIAKLNAILTNELTAVNQYFLHARMYENWGFNKLGKKTYEESIGEMKHADLLIKRVLFLEGLPNLQDLGKLSIGETVPEGLSADLELEKRGRTTLIEAIQLCEQARDYISREIVKQILDDTEEHIDFLETQLSILDSVGLDNYLQLQAYPANEK